MPFRSTPFISIFYLTALVKNQSAIYTQSLDSPASPKTKSHYLHLLVQSFFLSHKHTKKWVFVCPTIVQAKQLIPRSLSNTKQAASDVPKGYVAVYVGDESKMKLFVIPLSHLNQPSFQEVLSQAEEKFGYDHPMGALTIPCREETFLDLISHLNSSCLV
ncbi:hypothetical protein UlMin_042678 [Ulmus minor]